MPKIKNIDLSELSKTTLDSFNILKCSPGAFTGGTDNTRGDKDGTKAVLPLFKVTGVVLARIFAVGTVDLVGAATLEVGVAGNTASLIAQLANATSISAGKIWSQASCALGVQLLSTVLGPYIVSAGHLGTITIDEKVASADITAGNLDYYILWRPISPDGNVESLFPPAIS
jgi:hypothetical protein